MADVLAQLRGPSMIAFSIYLVFELVEASIPSGNLLLRDLVDTAREVLLLPFFIAIYRLLILGEITSEYGLTILIPGFQRLLGWTIALSAVFNLPPLVLSLITSSDTINAIAYVVFLILGVILTVRITLLFPAIAVDARGATLELALADTSGRGWLIVKAYFIVFLPLLLSTMMLAVLAWRGIVGDVLDLADWSAFPQIMLTGTIGFFTDAASAVLAAWLFVRIGDRVKAGAPNQAG